MDDDRPGARVTLPPIDEVEVPSIILIERAYQRSLHDVICRKDMFRIWQKVGAACAATMLQGKGVRFPGIADLTFDVKGLPMYSLERDMNVLLKQFGSGHGSVAKSLNARRAKKDRARRAAGVVEPPNKHKRTFDRAVVGMVAPDLQRDDPRAHVDDFLALTLDDVGEFVYYSGPSGDGLGARGYLGARFRLTFAAAAQTRGDDRAPEDALGVGAGRWHALRARVPRPSVVEPKKLLAAPGMGELYVKGDGTLAGRNAIKTIKFRLVERCGIVGLHTFVKALSSMDESGDGVYDAEELRWGLREFGISVSEDDCLALVQMFDEDGGGTLSLDELMVAIREGAMPPNRVAMVRRVFHMLCRDAGLPCADGVEITTDRIRQRFDPFGDERVERGDPNWPPKDVTNNFFAVLDDSGDGQVSDAEFMRMYENISPAVEDDGDFKRMLDKFWPAFWPPLGDLEMGGRVRGAFSRGHAGYGFTGDQAGAGYEDAAPALRATDERDVYLDGILDMADAEKQGGINKRLDKILDDSAKMKRKARPPPFSHHRDDAVDEGVDTFDEAPPRNHLLPPKAADGTTPMQDAATKRAAAAAARRTRVREAQRWGQGHFDTFEKHHHL
ncbi:serine/threonine kinase [Aureococcus anophagefferens]|nr:serine/threonine kinase [Aureococcus anophagefferens]